MSKQSVMKTNMQKAPNPKYSAQPKQDRLSIYERSVLQKQKTEQKLKRIEAELMSEYTFVPNMSFSKAKSKVMRRLDSSSSQRTPNRELKMLKGHPSLQTTPDTTLSSLQVTSKEENKAHGSHTASPPMERSLCCDNDKYATVFRLSNGTVSKSKLIMEQKRPRQYQRSAAIPFEVFLTPSPVAEGKVIRMESLVGSLSETVSCGLEEEEADYGSV